jgi:hypothetical protein
LTIEDLWRFVRGHDASWGVMTRVGFSATSTPQSSET